MKAANIPQTFIFFVTIAVLNSCSPKPKPKQDDTNIIGEYNAILTDAPNVPKSDPYKAPEKVVVKLEVIEKVMRLADGVEYNFWTFGGKTPGKFIRIRQGDLVEFYLSNNPNNKMPHNIDLHAVTGPGGGAEASMTAPGHTSQFSFRALHPGLYVYHCATAPVGMHIGNGMYGLILVEPKEGLSPVDKEFYVMQSDIYTKGEFGKPGLQAFDMEKALKEQPEYVVFNGSVGALLGDNAMHVKVGERIRLYVGNAGPNLVSSFHIIGGIFDSVREGPLVNHDVQSVLIPAGGAVTIELKFDVPGTYNLVDHSIFRAFNKGALAQIIVSGDENKDIYSHKQRDIIYLPEGGAIQSIIDANSEPAAAPKRTKEERLQLGETLFVTNCSACHMKDGQGVPGAFPPLAKSDFLMGRSDKGIGILLHGLQNPVTVKGKTFNGIMPQLGLTDDVIANILTYVRNSWGNQSDMITADDVAKLRAKDKK